MLVIDRSVLKNCLFLNARHQKSILSVLKFWCCICNFGPYHYGVTGREFLRFRYLVNHRVHVWTNTWEQWSQAPAWPSSHVKFNIPSFAVNTNHPLSYCLLQTSPTPMTDGVLSELPTYTEVNITGVRNSMGQLCSSVRPVGLSASHKKYENRFFLKHHFS